MDAERCGDLEVPLNHFPGGGKLDSSESVAAGARLVDEPFEEDIVRHEKIRADDRCTRHGSPMFALQ